MHVGVCAGVRARTRTGKFCKPSRDCQTSQELQQRTRMQHVKDAYTTASGEAVVGQARRPRTPLKAASFSPSPATGLLLTLARTTTKAMTYEEAAPPDSEAPEPWPQTARFALVPIPPLGTKGIGEYHDFVLCQPEARTFRDAAGRAIRLQSCVEGTPRTPKTPPQTRNLGSQ
ncbi:hypothetical protein GWK47_046439 [Chionoecetes opilio]|uniref:Uncharacterized protein n=1 Tax=Chionoecetes opilio TaxID=41210 RepID=A0A8J4YEM9_CHIOP|nr:hypothetical protein GWK47_046439 [Chionoecetes opilio]